MFSRTRLLSWTSTLSGRKFSIAARDGVKAQSGASKFVSFIRTHRQQLFNMLGVYLVVTVGYQNYKTSQKQKSLEARVLTAEETLKNVEDRINDEEWIQDLVSKATNSQSPDKVKYFKEALAMVKLPVAKKESSKDDELVSLLSEFEGSDAPKSSGANKII